MVPIPRNTIEPIPAASSPGSSTSGSIGPPNPAASMMMTAPMTGLPKIVEIAAKLPAAAMINLTWSGAPLRTMSTVRIPSPPPRASKGASGPSTTPNPIPAMAASMTPGSMPGSIGGPDTSPPAGRWPPWPGSLTMA